jgi:hypothetical protein
MTFSPLPRCVLTFFDDSFWLATTSLRLRKIIGNVYSRDMVDELATVVAIRIRKLRLMSIVIGRRARRCRAGGGGQLTPRRRR